MRRLFGRTLNAVALSLRIVVRRAARIRLEHDPLGRLALLDRAHRATRRNRRWPLSTSPPTPPFEAAPSKYRLCALWRLQISVATPARNIESSSRCRLDQAVDLVSFFV